MISSALHSISGHVRLCRPVPSICGASDFVGGDEHLDVVWLVEHSSDVRFDKASLGLP